MERQWRSRADGYLETMIGLTDYVTAKGYRVVLIPNQDNGKESRLIRRSDSRVAAGIRARVSDQSRVSVVAVCGRSGLERKSDIARCSLLISPRYHACVSAMTCAVPTLTIGWHAKYQELARLYGQEEWLLPSEDCSLKTLEETFGRMMARREEIADSIRAHQPAVRQAVIDSGRELVMKEGYSYER